jgi:hypothetical protein
MTMRMLHLNRQEIQLMMWPKGISNVVDLIPFILHVSLTKCAL